MGFLNIIRKEGKGDANPNPYVVTIVLKIISPTLGFNIKTIEYQKYSLDICDVDGQKTIRSFWRNHFERTDGLVWVVDSSDVRRLDDCRSQLENLLKEEVLNLDAMDKTRHWHTVGCTAYTGEGLLERFDWLA